MAPGIKSLKVTTPLESPELGPCDRCAGSVCTRVEGHIPVGAVRFALVLDAFGIQVVELSGGDADERAEDNSKICLHYASSD